MGSVDWEPVLVHHFLLLNKRHFGFQHGLISGRLRPERVVKEVIPDSCGLRTDSADFCVPTHCRGASADAG